MLSERGLKWSVGDYAHGQQDVYDRDGNPRGVVSFANAENWMLHAELNKQSFDAERCSYGEGYTGTLRLRPAMARHLNSYFRPATAFLAEEITFAAGLTSLNEACALVLCDAGDIIMLGQPVYGLSIAIFRRGHGYVPVGNEQQFLPDSIAALDAGFNAAKAAGKTIKALIICNPHNPLGRCYPRETLVEILHLCDSKGIHLISDEIYALSAQDREDRPSEEFVSVRSIDLTNVIDPSQVHVMYGMSKDGLLRNRLLAESLLNQAGIRFYDKENASLFVWLDLSPHLPIGNTEGDAWAAERLLSQQLQAAGVIMATGKQYHAEQRGRFRVIFCVDEETLREGIRR
ncbi:acc synthase, partial [Penicillium chermesinum]